MTILMTGGDIPDIDYDPTPVCKCGHEMEWADCWMIDCEDGYYDLGEVDCINYGPGTYEKCTGCDGQGGGWYCPSKSCTADRDTCDGDKHGL